jgi:hypothetical protein
MMARAFDFEILYDVEKGVATLYIKPLNEAATDALYEMSGGWGMGDKGLTVALDPEDYGPGFVAGAIESVEAAAAHDWKDMLVSKGYKVRINLAGTRR